MFKKEGGDFMKKATVEFNVNDDWKPGKCVDCPASFDDYNSGSRYCYCAFGWESKECKVRVKRQYSKATKTT